MTLIITRKDGKIYNLKDLGIRVIEFEPESLNITNNFNKLALGGYVVNNNGFDVRFIDVLISFSPFDIESYASARSEIFDIFGSEEEFYLNDTKEPGKVWTVIGDGNFASSRNVHSGTVSLRFACVKPYSESVFSSFDLMNKKEWDENLFYWGMGINWDDEYNYSFNTNNFTLNNVGTATVDPRSSGIVIRLQGVGQGLTLRNLSTGDVFEYNGPIASGNVVELRGILSYKDGVNIFTNTNMQLITLKPGLNNFEITRCNVQKIDFDFKFLYK